MSECDAAELPYMESNKNCGRFAADFFMLFSVIYRLLLKIAVDLSIITRLFFPYRYIQYIGLCPLKRRYTAEWGIVAVLVNFCNSADLLGWNSVC